MNDALFLAPLGAWVSIDCGFYRHVGVVSDRLDANGWPMVISCSRRAGRVVEEPWLAFSGGRVVHCLGMRGPLLAHQVVARGRSGIGQRYLLLDWNCEHFVRWASGLKPQSPQLQGYLAFGAVGTALYAATRIGGPAAVRLRAI